MLALAGLRIGELLDLRWRDVNLAADRLTVRAAETDAGVRQVDVLPALAEVMGDLPRRGPDDRVFPTSKGKRHSPGHIRQRILAPAVDLANERLEQQGEPPLPLRLTPHKLRHTFASVLVAIGTDLGAVMDQLGHTDPAFTLRVYGHGMRRDDESRMALKQLVGLGTGSGSGSNVRHVVFGTMSDTADLLTNPAVSR